MSGDVRTNYPRRLRTFEYVGCYRYFLTFCTHKRFHAFTDVDAVNLTWSHFLRAADANGFAISACCFMPDHTHLVAEGESDESDMKRFVTAAKQSSGYYYRQSFGRPLWQRYGYDHVLRGDESTRQVVAYVLENPVRARLVEAIDQYPHFRSSRYDREELIEFAYGS